MKKRSSAYWKKRFLDLEAASNAYGQDAFMQIEPAFDSAQRNIQAEIEKWYGRYAKNNGITMQEAKRQLSTKELKEFRWDVEEYIKYGEENALNHQWMKQLENASARVHVNRLEALKIRMQHAAEKAFGNELDVLDDMARKVFTEDYYQAIYEVHKGFGIGWNIGQIDERKLDTLITKPWAADGKNFSERIWGQRAALVNELHQQLTRACILGKAPDDAIKAISKKFNTTKNQAGRLVMTEQAYFHSVAQKEAFEDLDVEEFEFVATLDSHTSEICQDMDGKHFPMSEYQPGLTAPPLHVWCRSVTVPWFEDNYTGERAARGADGKTYYVPDSLTYPEWKKSLVNGNGQGLQVVDNLDSLKAELAAKLLEIGQLDKDIRQVQSDRVDWKVDGQSPAFQKFDSMTDDERDTYIKGLQDEKTKLEEEYKKLKADHDRWYDRPDRGTPEREAWQEWRNSVDINDIFDKLMKNDSRQREITSEIKLLPKYEAFKQRFGDITDKDFQDKLDDLFAKKYAVEKEVSDLKDRIAKLEKEQAEVAFSAANLKDIQDEIIKKHDSIIKSDIQKKEFADIIDGMNKERANLYDKLSEVFPQNHYYDKGTGWYSPWKRRVEMDLNSHHWDDSVGRNLKGAWKTKFHEEMHQLDHILGNTKSKFALVDGTTDSYVMDFTNIRTASGKKMITAIDDDIVKLINTAVDWENSVSGGKIKRIKDLGRISSDAKRSVIRYLHHICPTAKDRALIDTVTDAIGMTTSGKIHPRSQGFWGHTMAYSKNNGKNGATSEAWANLAGFMLRGDTEALDAVKKLMPKTVETYQSIFDEVLEYAKTNDLKYK